MNLEKSRRCLKGWEVYSSVLISLASPLSIVMSPCLHYGPDMTAYHVDMSSGLLTLRLHLKNCQPALIYYFKF